MKAHRRFEGRAARQEGFVRRRLVRNVNIWLVEKRYSEEKRGKKTHIS